jgi:hypothetical protein
VPLKIKNYEMKNYDKKGKNNRAAGGFEALSGALLGTAAVTKLQRE